jgi:hypothetical protein
VTARQGKAVVCSVCGIGLEQGGKPTRSAKQPAFHGRQWLASYAGNLRRGEVGAESQSDYFPVSLAENRECLHHSIPVGDGVLGQFHRRDFRGPDALQRRTFDLCAPVVVPQPIDRDRIQPCRPTAAPRIKTVAARNARSKTSPSRSSARARLPVR